VSPVFLSSTNPAGVLTARPHPPRFPLKKCARRIVPIRGASLDPSSDRVADVLCLSPKRPPLDVERAAAFVYNIHSCAMREEDLRAQAIEQTNFARSDGRRSLHFDPARFADARGRMRRETSALAIARARIVRAERNRAPITSPSSFARRRAQRSRSRPAIGNVRYGRLWTAYWLRAPSRRSAADVEAFEWHGPDTFSPDGAASAASASNDAANRTVIPAIR